MHYRANSITMHIQNGVVGDICFSHESFSMGAFALERLARNKFQLIFHVIPDVMIASRVEVAFLSEPDAESRVIGRYPLGQSVSPRQSALTLLYDALSLCKDQSRYPR